MTFLEVYENAKEIYNTNSDHKPMEPEVRYYGAGEWVIESGLYPAEDVHLSCDLDTFDTYFYEAYQGNYDVVDRDEAEFISVLESWSE